jgi:hypothetical protein
MIVPVEKPYAGFWKRVFFDALDRNLQSAPAGSSHGLGETDFFRPGRLCRAHRDGRCRGSAAAARADRPAGLRAARAPGPGRAPDQAGEMVPAIGAGPRR